MDSVKTKDSFLAKTWKRCRSFPRSNSSSSRITDIRGLSKSRSWNGEKTKKMTTPVGFIPVCVGPDKQRFAVKTKYVNHPLFIMLLEDAVTEYAYNCNGPILLTCDVDLFYKVLAEMQAKNHVQPLGWNFVYGSCSPFSPSRRLGTNGADQMTKGYGSFEALISSRLIKMN